MQQIKRIIQPNGWSCLAACCAMLAGVSIVEVFESFGHDGGSPDPEAPDGLRAFDLLGAVKFLADHRILLGGFIEFPQGQKISHAPKLLLIRNGQALVIVETSEKTTHAVVWDGKRILDPHPLAADSMSVKNYLVRQWWPAMQVIKGA